MRKIPYTIIIERLAFLENRLKLADELDWSKGELMIRIDELNVLIKVLNKP